jgi:preprotein translocase SecF subunit
MTDITLSTADVITPAKRPRMNGIAVPSGTRRRGRNDCSFKKTLSQAQWGAARGCQSHALARLNRLSPRDTIREAFAPLGFGDLRVQEFGSPRDVLVRFDNKTQLQDTQRMITARVAEALPKVEIRRIDVVGARVSGELFRNGLLATALALVAVLIYIWFRFEWQFGVGIVATLILDVTKTVGFFAVTQIEFDLNSVAAILTLIGYSVTDKVVVYDRIRENLGKYRTMPLRELIDLSINQTLGRTVATSLTVVLSILPLALIGGEAMRGFALAIIFGIIIGTSSSIFIASPILLFLGENRLRRSSSPAPQQKGPIAAQ